MIRLADRVVDKWYGEFPDDKEASKSVATLSQFKEKKGQDGTPEKMILPSSQLYASVMAAVDGVFSSLPKDIQETCTRSFAFYREKVEEETYKGNLSGLLESKRALKQFVNACCWKDVRNAFTSLSTDIDSEESNARDFQQMVTLMGDGHPASGAFRGARDGPDIEKERLQQEKELDAKMDIFRHFDRLVQKVIKSTNSFPELVGLQAALSNKKMMKLGILIIDGLQSATPAEIATMDNFYSSAKALAGNPSRMLTDAQPTQTQPTTAADPNL